MSKDNYIRRSFETYPVGALVTPVLWLYGDRADMLLQDCVTASKWDIEKNIARMVLEVLGPNLAWIPELGKYVTNIDWMFMDNANMLYDEAYLATCPALEGEKKSFSKSKPKKKAK